MHFNSINKCTTEQRIAIQALKEVKRTLAKTDRTDLYERTRELIKQIEQLSEDIKKSLGE